MAKRILIDLRDEPILSQQQMKELVSLITFAVETFLEIHEYTLEVKDKNE